VNRIVLPFYIDFTNYNTVEARAANVEDLEWHVEQMIDGLGEMDDRITKLETTKSNPSVTLPIHANDVSIYGDSLYTWADQQVENIADCVYNIMPSNLAYRLEQLENKASNPPVMFHNYIPVLQVL
jgi:hypothetical protein